MTGPVVTDADRAEVLRLYRKERRFHDQPYWAMRAVEVAAATRYAIGARIGIAPGDDTQLRDLAQFAAASDYAHAITERYDRKYWFRGRIGGAR